MASEQSPDAVQKLLEGNGSVVAAALREGAHQYRKSGLDGTDVTGQDLQTLHQLASEVEES